MKQINLFNMLFTLKMSQQQNKITCYQKYNRYKEKIKKIANYNQAKEIRKISVRDINKIT